MAIVKFEAFGKLTSPLRNIRCHIDAHEAVFELVPEALRPPGPDPVDVTGIPSPLVRVISSASLVLESERMLRIEIGELRGIAVDADVDIDLFGGLTGDGSEQPRLAGSTFFYPLIEIENSPWKAQLPDWRGRDDPDIRHLRMISATCSYDVLGEVLSGNWMPNSSMK